MRTTKLSKILGLATAAFYLIGCSSGGGGGGGASSGVGVNLLGKVSTTSSVGGLGFFKAMQKMVMMDVSGAGCTANAYNLNGSTILGTGTADNSGQFVISGANMVAGQSYKVVTTCPNGNIFTAIIGADATAPANKTAAPVDPVTTLITTEVVNAIVNAVINALAQNSGLPQEALDAIKASLLSPTVINSIVSTISSTIQAAIVSGSMQAPTAAASTSMSTAITTATTENPGAITTAETAYTTNSGGTANTIPAAVTSGVAGAAQSAAAFPGCDPTLALAGVGSADNCVKAIAGMMFNILHFDIAILNDDNGVFGAFDCAPGDPILDAAFSGAVYSVGSSADINDTNFCVIRQAVASQDRNQGYNNGGKGGGPLFAEAGYTVTSGVLTEIGTAYFNNVKYHLSDLDRIAFTSGGMNGRLLYAAPTNLWPALPIGGGNYNWQGLDYKLLANNSGTTAINTGVTWPTCPDGSPCDARNKDFIFLSNLDDWGTDTLASSLALSTAIGNSAYAGSVFFNKFGGAIPTEDKLLNDVVNGTTHNDNNRTGQSKFFVLYTKQPDWQDPNCQWSSNSSAPVDYAIPTLSNTAHTPSPTKLCVATDGTPNPQLQVFVGIGSTSPTGVSQIDNITTTKTTGQSGPYFVMPMMNGRFGGLLQLVNAANGQFMVDEFMNQRFIQVILDPNQCGDASPSTAISGIPASTAGCVVGNMYNVTASWNNCNGGGNNCPAVSASSAQVANAINGGTVASPFTLSQGNGLSYQPNQIWNGNKGIIGATSQSGNFNGSYTPIYVTLSSGAVMTSKTGGTQVAGTDYTIQQYWICNSGPCTLGGYFMVDSSGVPNTTIPAASGLSTASVCVSGPGCMPVTAVIYTDDYLNLLGTGIFHFSDTGTGTWQNVAEQVMVNSGPATNPNYNCALDPFFIDGSGTGTSNGKLDFNLDSSAPGGISCTEISFNDAWSAAGYVQGGNGQSAHSGAHIVVNQHNGFVYGDPKAAAALIHAAFGPWLDGTHSLTTSTDLNAFQSFSLIFMFFSSRDGGSNGDMHYIPNILSSGSNLYQALTPTCNEDKGPDCNIGIGNGIHNLHH